MVDSTKIERNARKSEWASRYNDRDLNNEYATQPVEDGQVPDAPPVPSKKSSTRNGDPLWRPEDEGYYGESSNRRNSRNASNASLDSSSRSTGRWHYPANFDDATEIEPPRKSSKSKSKSSGAGKDRWARTEEARLGVPDEGSERRKRRKSTSRTYTDDSSSYREGPEDPFAGNYGNSSRPAAVPASREGADDLNHEF